MVTLTTLLGLLPALIKGLGVALLGLFYWLFTHEKAKRKQAEQARDNAQASFEVAQETGKIREEEIKVVETIKDAGPDELAGLYHTGLRQSKPKG